MHLHRRQFLKTTAGLTLGSIAASALPFGASFARTNPRPRIAVLWDERYGTAANRKVSLADIKGLFDAATTKYFTADELPGVLDRTSFDLLIIPTGPDFPANAFPAILSFLRSGGNLLSVGGTPFAVPWHRTGTGFTEGIRQVNYHKALGITQSFRIPVTDGGKLETNSIAPASESLTGSLNITAVHALYYRLAETNDLPNESGSAGTQDAVITPLVWNIVDGKRTSAPIVQIDQLRGPFAGGRWIIAPIEGRIEPNAVRTLAEMALEGAMRLHARPGYACYRSGELPVIDVQFHVPGGNAAAIVRGKLKIEFRDSRNRIVTERTAEWNGSGSLLTASVPLDKKTAGGLTPGLYSAEVTQDVGSEEMESVPVRYTTGFWMEDAALMKSGATYTVDGYYFRKNGDPYPVTGTTYMTSDIHRKFLFDPNPFLWQKDFAAMRAAGINMVRTGIWTAWRNYMLDPGSLNETTMRSLDAFLHTARAADMPVIFTFFAFLPELWNGENAYLDPRSVEAQKEFVSLIVRRYASMNDVMWDHINEPSFCNPNALWSCRPNSDRYEQAAWTAWLAQKYPAATAAERESTLRQQYRLRPDESLGLPGTGDFTGSAILYDKRPLKTVDYKFFAQAKFAEWSTSMTAAIRANGNPAQLITVGQDEAGTGDSPSPHFFAQTVDFTSLHNWWLNDDLVWDSVMTKVHGKANLIEETGVMFYERIDGSAYRSETEAAQLLDRKIAISLGTGGAGFIQWIWNINPLMKNDNEATIGLVRADGTVKPEFDVVRKYARFIGTHSGIFEEREDETAVMLIPHAQIFSPRNSASEATKRAVRTMTYGLGIPLRSVAEHADPAAVRGAKLIIVPAPRTLTDKGWELLKQAVSSGSTVMMSGIIDENEFYINRKRSAALGLTAAASVIVQEEIVPMNGVPHRFSFRGEKMQQLEKADLSPAQEQQVIIVPHGKGKFIWSPVPLENSESADSLLAYYTFAAAQANIAPLFKAVKAPSILILPQLFRRHVMYTLVSETSEDTEVRFRHASTSPEHSIMLPSQQAVLVILDRSTGALIGRSDRT